MFVVCCVDIIEVPFVIGVGATCVTALNYELVYSSLIGITLFINVK